MSSLSRPAQHAASTSSPDPRRRALGRGLEALLPSRSPDPPSPPALPPGEGKPLDLALDHIERNPFQTRTQFNPEKLRELAQSIAAMGVLQPILVRKVPGTEEPPRYQLIAGERRLMASREAGRQTIPAVVSDASDEQAMEMTIVENLQRADLNPMEQARAYHRLSTDFKMTQEQMAVRTGKDRASVGNFIRLLKLPDSVQSLVASGQLSFGHARTLLALPSAEAITAAAQKVLALSLPVRQTEHYVHGLLNPESKSKPEKLTLPQDPNVQEAQRRLQQTLGLKVRVEDKSGKGKVVIEYACIDDFDLLMSALGLSHQA